MRITNLTSIYILLISEIILYLDETIINNKIILHSTLYQVYIRSEPWICELSCSVIVVNEIDTPIPRMTSFPTWW